MRVGQNPAKFVKEVPQPERITVAVLNYIPFVSGFYANLPEVVDTCLSRIRETADLPFDLLVFDNGSCEEVRQISDRTTGCRARYNICSFPKKI